MRVRKPSNSLPLGFADQLLDLQMKLQDDESLELVQTITQLYRIGVDFYLECDLKKAQYMQRKLNHLTARAVQLSAIQNRPPCRVIFQKKMKQQVEKLNGYEGAYLASLVNQSQRSQKKIQQCVLADLTKQQRQFQDRMLKRIKSAGKL